MYILDTVTVDYIHVHTTICLYMHDEILSNSYILHHACTSIYLYCQVHTYCTMHVQAYTCMHVAIHTYTCTSMYKHGALCKDLIIFHHAFKYLFMCNFSLIWNLRHTYFIISGQDKLF